ncbi:hypothetical protein [Microbacterium oleivorans]|uniref:hypothetical protein n=1 Tax=Microbacterium oleivorans TaxID=273677 RepID=UPI00080ED5EF|nr:hypothetical protein [Microbacterium oleivorans]
MTTTWKTSVLLVSALVGGSLAAVAPMEPAAANTQPATDIITPAAANIITKSGRIVDFYTELGIAANEIPAVDPAHTASLEAVIQVALDDVSATSPVTTAAVACSDTGALVAHARQVAAMNKARDTRAKSLDEETVYMYMSHYFDLPSPCASNTAYYPSWITNSDRQAYGNFLTATGMTDLAASTGQMVLSATTLASNPASSIDNIFNGDAVDRLAGGLDLADKLGAGRTLVEELGTVSAQLDTGATPEDIVDGMHSRLSTTWGTDDLISVIIGTGAALMVPTVGAAVFGLGAVAVSLQITGFNTIVQHAAYNALRYTTSSRTSARLMRSLGW